MATAPQRPRWRGIPLRVALLTCLFTLLAFALALFLCIVGTMAYSWIAHVPADFRYAYRHIAFPFAVTAGSVALVSFLIMEIRQYQVRWTLDALGRAGMKLPRIAIPIPHGGDRAYAERALPQYEDAVRWAGGEPVRIALDLSPSAVRAQAETCDGVLLPGSRADIDPRTYGAERHPKTNESDPRRDAVDHALMDAAYAARRPLLAICYGLQTLNVYRSGTLVQHLESAINHSPGRATRVAHTVAIEPDSRIGRILGPRAQALPVNSSHHQSADVVGKDLRVVARCREDGVVEALEGTHPDHFVVAVQWHPERSVRERDADLGGAARAIFQAFVEAAKEGRTRTPGGMETLHSQKSGV